MEHLFERFHRAVGQDASGLDKKTSHLLLPTIIDLAAGHAGLRPFKVLRFEVPDQQSIWTQEQRVVFPSRLAQRREHFRPHAAVAGLVFLEPLRFYLQNEANTLHAVPSRLVKPESNKQLFSASTLTARMPPKVPRQPGSRARSFWRSARSPTRRLRSHSPAAESGAGSVCVVRRSPLAWSAVLPWIHSRRRQFCTF